MLKWINHPEWRLSWTIVWCIHEIGAWALCWFMPLTLSHGLCPLHPCLPSTHLHTDNPTHWSIQRDAYTQKGTRAYCLCSYFCRVFFPQPGAGSSFCSFGFALYSMGALWSFFFNLDFPSCLSGTIGMSKFRHMQNIFLDACMKHIPCCLFLSVYTRYFLSNFLASSTASAIL